MKLGLCIIEVFQFCMNITNDVLDYSVFLVEYGTICCTSDKDTTRISKLIKNIFIWWNLNLYHTEKKEEIFVLTHYSSNNLL